MKIIHFIDGEVIPYGGPYQYIKRLKKGMAEYDVEFFYLIRKDRIKNLESLKDLSNVYIYDGNDFIKVLKQINGNLINIHQKMDCELQYCINKYPTVFILHDTAALCPKCFFTDNHICGYTKLNPKCIDNECISNDLFEEWTKQLKILKQCDMVAYFSESSKKWLLDNGFNKSKLFNIPPLIEGQLSEFAQSSDNTIMYAGRICAQKGIELLLRAVAEIHGTNWRLVIAGSGEQQECYNLNIIAKQLGIFNKVRFIGYKEQPQLKEYLLKTKVFVFSSIGHETYGFSGAEASSYGIPVVAFDVCGIEQWLKNDYNGLIVENRNITKMSQAIEKLLLVDKEYQKLYDNSCSISKMINIKEQINNIYNMYFKLSNKV